MIHELGRYRRVSGLVFELNRRCIMKLGSCQPASGSGRRTQSSSAKIIGERIYFGRRAYGTKRTANYKERKQQLIRAFCWSIPSSVGPMYHEIYLLDGTRVVTKADGQETKVPSCSADTSYRY